MDDQDDETGVGEGLYILGHFAQGFLALRSAESLKEKIKEETSTEDVEIRLHADGEDVALFICGRISWVSGCCDDPSHALEELKVWCAATFGIYPIDLEEDDKAEMLALHCETMRQAFPV